MGFLLSKTNSEGNHQYHWAREGAFPAGSTSLKFAGAYTFLCLFRKSTDRTLRLFLFFLFLTTPVFAKEYSDVEIVEAIYKAEGGSKATYPFGIRSVNCNSYQECRKICANTVRRNRERFRDYGHKSHSEFISFLASRYAPINANNDPKGLNKNWIKNVRFFLERGSYETK